MGLDIAKHVFQAHGVDKAGRVVLKRKLRPVRLRDSSATWSHAWLALRPVEAHTTGRG